MSDDKFVDADDATKTEIKIINIKQCINAIKNY